MNRPPYAALRRNYPDRRSVSSEELYVWIGHPELFVDPNWVNTCAIRMSLALAGVGIHTPGRLLVKNGKYKGRMIEPGQRRVADFLSQRQVWGSPEKFKGGPAAQKGIGARQGVIDFRQLWGESDRQGHIDLVAPGYWGATCEEDCYWSSVEVRFWELP